MRRCLFVVGLCSAVLMLLALGPLGTPNRSENDDSSASDSGWRNDPSPLVAASVASENVGRTSPALPGLPFALASAVPAVGEQQAAEAFASPLPRSTPHPAGLTTHLAAGPGILTGAEYHLGFRRTIGKRNKKIKETVGVWVDARPGALRDIGPDAATRLVRANRVVRDAMNAGDSRAKPGSAPATMTAACLYGAFRADDRVERLWPNLRSRLFKDSWRRSTSDAPIPNASRLAQLDRHPLAFLEPDLFVSTWDFVIESRSQKDEREYGGNRTVWRGHPMTPDEAAARVQRVYGSGGSGNGDWLRGWHVASHTAVASRTRCQRMWCIVPLIKSMCLVAAARATADGDGGKESSRLSDYRYLLVHRMDRVPEHPLSLRGPACFAPQPDPLAARLHFTGAEDPRNDTDVDRDLVAGCFLHVGECATFYGYRLFYPDAPVMRGRAIVHLPVSKFDRFDRWTWVSDFTAFGFVAEVARQLLGTIAFVAEALERDEVMATTRVAPELVNAQGFEVAGVHPLGLNFEFQDVRARARHSSRITTTSCGKSMPGRLVAICGNHEMRTHKQVGSADCGKRRAASPYDS